jgi:hypothetical protein
MKLKQLHVANVQLSALKFGVVLRRAEFSTRDICGGTVVVVVF